MSPTQAIQEAHESATNSLQTTQSSVRSFIIFLCAACSVGYLAYTNREFQLDDALIYLRYVRNLFEGHGLVYNSGEHFNGLTSPLYSYLVILTGLVLKNLQTTNIVLSAIFHSISATALTLCFFRHRGIFVQAFSAIFFGVNPFFYNTFGMETPLLIMLMALTIYTYTKGNFFYVGLLSGLMFLTRSESILLSLVILLDYVWRNKKLPDAKLFILPILLVIANITFNKFYYGNFLPATASAKIGQGKSGLWGDGAIFLNISYMPAWFFNNDKILLWASIILTPLGVISLQFSTINRIVVPFLFFYGAICTALNIPNYHWYYAPFFAFSILYIAQAIFWIFDNFLQSSNKLFLAIGCISVVLLGIYLTVSNFTISNVARGPHTTYREIGKWLNANTPENAEIATVEIGTVGWYSDRYIIDILGLVSPLNADFIANRKFDEWLKHYNPDYILVHDPLWGHEAGVKPAIESNAFIKVENFSFSGYALLKRAK